MIELSDTDLLSRLTNFEDAFVERKSTGDMKDLLKTAVAFANSTPVGYPAILFYGVTDKGEAEGRANLDTLQKTISDKLSDAYPPIYNLPKTLQVDGKQLLAVIIPGSENRPHFAGRAYIREGSRSVPSSESQFRTLIAQRTSTAREILTWRGKEVTAIIESRNPFAQQGFAAIGTRDTTLAQITTIVVDCNQFYLTLRRAEANAELMSFPLRTVELSFDHKNSRLTISGLKIPS
jgi:Schlafen, AlbA_2